MDVKSLKKQLMAAIAMVLVAAVALSSATYAWFVNNATVTATGAKVKAATAYSLLISNDNTNFGTTTAFDTGLTTLVPVSTSGTLEATARTNIAANDGVATNKFDLLFAASSTWAENHVTGFTEVGKNSKVDGNPYFYTDTIYLKAAQDGSIYLDSSALGIEWDYWDTSTHAVNGTKLYTFSDFATLSVTDTGATSSEQVKNLADYQASLSQAQALLATLRVGFVVTYEASSTETLVGTYIYQLTDKTLTNRVNTTDNSSEENIQDGADGVTGAVSVAADNYDITVATGNLKSSNAIKTSTSTGIPVISGITGSATTLATAQSSDVAIVSEATANTVYTVDTYIWMEGCDLDTAAATLSQFNVGSISGIQFGFCLGEVPATT